MPDVIGETADIVGGFAPDFNFGGTMNIITWVIILIIFIGIGGVAAYMIIKRLKFKHKIVIFEKLGGRFEPTAKDRAMELKLSKSGDTIFYLSKRKKYLPTPRLQTGKRTFWYFIREDGEWINFSPGDFDEQSRELGAKFLDYEMRYARTQIDRGLKERYDQPGFWKQYGLLVFSIAFIVIIGVMVWLLFDKWIALAATTNEAVETAGIVLDRTDQILSSLDNICSGGSGYVPS